VRDNSGILVVYSRKSLLSGYYLILPLICEMLIFYTSFFEVTDAS